VIVEVTDNGVGMDEATRVKLLQPDRDEGVQTERNGYADDQTEQEQDEKDPSAQRIPSAQSSVHSAQMRGHSTQSKGHSTGLGMRNVIRRMELFYQQQDLVEIESAPGEGTTVRITLPATALEKRGVQHVQSANR
jgi:sensor histidine kinase YesM